jgi:hypothetical protein
MDRMLDGLQSWSGYYGKEKNSSLLRNEPHNCSLYCFINLQWFSNHCVVWQVENCLGGLEGDKFVTCCCESHILQSGAVLGK